MERFGRLWSTRLACIALAGVLAGCTEYLDRKETIAFSAGDAISRNEVIHVIDPWPAHARNTRIVSSGERAARATARYENCYRREPEGRATIGGLTCFERAGRGAAASGAAAGGSP